MGMKEKDNIYRLIARKLSGEASKEELQELEELLRKNPEFHDYLRLVSSLWNAKQSGDPAVNDEVFKRIKARVEQKKRTEAEQLANQEAYSMPWEPQPKKRKRFDFLVNWNDMLANYFKLTFRILFRNKAFSSINITGLAIGIACTILILLLVRHEISYDQFHKNKDRTYLLYNRAKIDGKIECWSSTPMVLGSVLKTSYPEVEQVARVNWVAAFTLKAGDKQIQPEGYLTEPGFLKIFDFPLLKGNSETALNDARSIVITERLAKILFGNEEAMGKTIKIDSNALFTVAGVAKDLPNNTQFWFDYLVPWTYMKELGWDNPNWSENSIVKTYVLLKPGTSEETANNHFRNIIKTHAKDINNEVFVHPMKKWHLWSHFENGKIAGGGIEHVRMLGIIAGIILLIACINYMNLSTARSMKRAREVGIRKVVGARKGLLVGQFLWESILYAFIAAILALIIAQLGLNWFNNTMFAQLSIPWADIDFWLYGIVFIMLTGILAGSYPAFYLSAYKPMRVLKGIFKGPRALITPRKILVVAQFSFAITLIICTIIIYRQIDYAKNRDLGFNKENLAFVYLKGDMRKNYDLINRELKNSNAITDFTWTNSPIIDVWTWDDKFEWTGKDPGQRHSVAKYVTDNRFIKTFGLTLVAGRDINIEEYPADSTAMLLNETAANLMGFKDPIGQQIKNKSGTWHVVGVIKDFITSPYQSPYPVTIEGPANKNWFGTLSLRLNSKNAVNDNLAKIGDIFKKYNPDYTFDYRFADFMYDFRFFGEKQQAKLATFFAGLAILISCLGLFALSAYMAESRIKEIGVRKVLGASVARITLILSKDFLKLVLISFAIASPAAWWFMNGWLRDYPYRVSVSWWIFALTGVMSLLIAAATISYQSVRAAMTNPVKSLKTE